MKKVIIYFCLVVGVLIINSNVYAITNKNGVEISEKIYEQLVKYYGDDYLMTITNDDFEYLMSKDIDNIKMISYYDYPKYSLFSTNEITNYKNLKIIVLDNKVTVKLEWLVQPKVRNYDIIAARFSNLKLNNVIGAKYIYGNDYNLKSISGIQKFDNGLGVSFKLPSETIRSVYFEFTVSGSGVIYATYQHSTTNRINYAQSKNFYITNSGLGKVVSFKNGIDKYYDDMNGVSISVWFIIEFKDYAKFYLDKTSYWYFKG